MTDFFGSVRNTEMLNSTDQQDTDSLLQHLLSVREQEEEEKCVFVCVCVYSM